jgi:hypothetical protein
MAKRKIHSHTFNGKKYQVIETAEIDGIFDGAGKTITILCGADNVRTLGSALEEGLHAMNIPDRYLHKPERSTKTGESISKVDDLARFIWRLGYRRTK